MLPKVEVCLDFVKTLPGRIAVITSLKQAEHACEEGVGTKICSDRHRIEVSDEVPGNVFQYCSNLIVFDRQGGILESYRLDTDLIALCYAPDEQRWYSNRLPAGDHPDVSVFIPIDK